MNLDKKIHLNSIFGLTLTSLKLKFYSFVLWFILYLAAQFSSQHGKKKMLQPKTCHVFAIKFTWKWTENALFDTTAENEFDCSIHTCIKQKHTPKFHSDGINTVYVTAPSDFSSVFQSCCCCFAKQIAVFLKVTVWNPPAKFPVPCVSVSRAAW